MDNILLYIGTFDPIHRGHVHFCTEAMRSSGSSLCVIMPSGDNSYKSPSVRTSAQTRFEQCKIAFADIENIEVSDFEVKKQEYIYTLDTLAHVRGCYPNADVSLLMGSDTLMGIGYWKGSAEIIKTTKIYTACRTGDDATMLKHQCEKLINSGGMAVILDIATLDISSERIRKNPEKYKNFVF